MTDTGTPDLFRYPGIVARSPAMLRFFDTLDRVVAQELPVLILGESGVGKELVAKAIHYRGPRARKAFVSENCAALSELILESELFGHEKGAFTGADRRHRGLFEIADGGTLFLDEMGEMPLDTQKKLLRVLQEKQLRRVGGQETIPVDVRLLSATNRNLAALVKEGKFREDLYYRINVVSLTVPPLRERREDIPLLAEYFREELRAGRKGPARSFAPETLQLLGRYDWPGNVRELENEVRRLVAMGGMVIGPEHLSPAIRGEDGGGAEACWRRFLLPGKSLAEMTKALVEEFERVVIIRSLKAHDGRRGVTARELGLSRTSLYHRLKEWGMSGEGKE